MRIVVRPPTVNFPYFSDNHSALIIAHRPPLVSASTLKTAADFGPNESSHVHTVYPYSSFSSLQLSIVPVMPAASPSLALSRPLSPSPSARIVIQGITVQGRAFRPSDWAERLCGIMSSFGGDQQMRYSPYVRPVMLDGVRCVVVEPSLAEVEPRAYRFLLDFAHDNELIVIDPARAVSEDFCPLPDNALERLTR